MTVHNGCSNSLQQRDLTTILDQDVRQYEIVWAGGRTPFAVFALKTDDLQLLTDGKWLDLAQTGEERQQGK